MTGLNASSYSRYQERVSKLVDERVGESDRVAESEKAASAMAHDIADLVRRRELLQDELDMVARCVYMAVPIVASIRKLTGIAA